MKEASFDPAGDKLWIIVTMKGLYFMPYNYVLLGTGMDDPAVLSNPIRTNNNTVSIDDFYEILNDFNPGDALSRYHERVARVSMDIVKMDDDFGYEVSIGIWQTNATNVEVIVNQLNDGNPPFIKPLCLDTRQGKVGASKKLKEEKFFLLLMDKTK